MWLVCDLIDYLYIGMGWIAISCVFGVLWWRVMRKGDDD